MGLCEIVRSPWSWEYLWNASRNSNTIFCAQNRVSVQYTVFITVLDNQAQEKLHHMRMCQLEQ